MKCVLLNHNSFSIHFFHLIEELWKVLTQQLRVSLSWMIFSEVPTQFPAYRQTVQLEAVLSSRWPTTTSVVTSELCFMAISSLRMVDGIVLFIISEDAG